MKAMENELTAQELHNLAMNIVGQDLEENGFEFLGIKSKLKTNPQFVAIKERKLHFVLVRAVLYPNDPKAYDNSFMQKMKEHALKFKARTFYAGVGIANSLDYEKPVIKGEEYIVNYDGLQEIL